MRLSRTAIISVNVADKKVVEQTTNHFNTLAKLDQKKSGWKSCRKNSGPLLQRVIGFKIDLPTTLNEPFCIFSLSAIQSNGHRQNFFHPRNIQKDVTDNSHIDKGIQKCCFQEGRVGILR